MNHSRFEYKERHLKKEQKVREISFREQHIFDSTDMNMVGKLRNYTHVKRPKTQKTSRYVKMILALAIMAVVYFIYGNGTGIFGDELTKTIIGSFLLIILLVLFINKSNKR